MVVWKTRAELDLFFSSLFFIYYLYSTDPFKAVSISR